MGKETAMSWCRIFQRIAFATHHSAHDIHFGQDIKTTVSWQIDNEIGVKNGQKTGVPRFIDAYGQTSVLLLVNSPISNASVLQSGAWELTTNYCKLLYMPKDGQSLRMLTHIDSQNTMTFHECGGRNDLSSLGSNINLWDIFMCSNPYSYMASHLSRALDVNIPSALFTIPGIIDRECCL